MVSAKVRWYVAYMKPKSKDDGITLLVMSLHKYIKVYIVQEFKINQMTAAGCMNEWQIRFLQSEMKKWHEKCLRCRTAKKKVPIKSEYLLHLNNVF